MPRWILVLGLGGITLVGVLLLLGVLVPYVQGELEPSKQSGATASLDSAFVHSAASENISGNSTYLDDPITNGHPDALVYVTQDWNPGGSGSTYNDHPVGVWYDTDVQKWAIYNQDKAPMPVGAAYNVAVLEEPKKAR